MTLQPSRELEFEQDCPHRCRRTAGQSDEIVEANRSRSQQAYDALAFFLCGFVLVRPPTFGLSPLNHDRVSQDRLKDRCHVGHLRHQRRALFQETVAAFAARVER